ncbi:ATP-binding protein [Streptomyces caniscabiei]|uniref:ATP-binding protein n=1 Tax=Streptomyces caniscabiei TaxID=2746961 RepID=A0ABU4N4R8_9ACTN|nr:ATP-binding protein [Streptomyces caniscabiei]MDX2946875.1 ATP-binding protein [Streptomyces caniscabiei]MDX2955942.1 ATP-binding protein [Streptomyces caniscabiei]MDX2989721.1 ATP-binding protein [Streptomyces caniscabiei]MDX3013606.1 ATP-binding protein [Streptomyces caniscabiei]MDX3043558.1 ATP-binding protein [Streptomyces caniscabiei]
MTVVGDPLVSMLEGHLEALSTARRTGTIKPEAEAEVAAISRTRTRSMPPHPPFCVLMAGLPGSGKTTLSRTLTARGFTRLCPDEEMFRRHGVYGVDFPRGVFPTLERPVLEDVAADLREQLKAGHDVVVDHGFWTAEDRAKWRAIATDVGATPVLVYLAATHDELWARISKRNDFHANDPNSIYFSESDLQRYRKRFVPPRADEPHVLYDGDPAAVIAALEASRP